jgi:UDP-N-acetylglucosamine transferase subunit ALG13
MILVTTGSNGAPFDRLLFEVERFAVSDEIVVQHGPSRIRPSGATCVDFFPFGDLSALVAEARIVVAHAGVGSILVCAAQNRVPIVVPRLARFGEVVDDHQLSLARRLDELGTVNCVEDPVNLPAAIHSCVESPVAKQGPECLAIVADLKGYLDGVLL